MSTTRLCVAVPVLPAASVIDTETVCVLSARGVVTVTDQVPPAATVVVNV